ncbi:hypothetical protein BRAS3843_530008 [Bradyrhizobium sp. STM 3843]|uniref:hypothetical protein n=1 Tax=Bradyrhizobium sp. STM 3843 TaxID=551947 RepID=UPI00024035CB|nr:hypothetical protein [Bradyrhizobium sp. STM 3843]CCE10796.1 hypothetical protein BRAS3843_530008 [Bradyrhizobium sp. STM 3843]
MTSIGIQTLMLPLIGIHSALIRHELMEMLEIARILGNSCRLASSEPGSSLMYGRFTFDFCKTVAAAPVAGGRIEGFDGVHAAALRKSRRHERVRR